MPTNPNGISMDSETLDFEQEEMTPMPAEHPAADNQTGESELSDAQGNENGKMVLRTDNLVKKYGRRTVVNHVSINVTQGEIVGLLGPNGAGKTTTFYMTVGLITPNEGKIGRAHV